VRTKTWKLLSKVSNKKEKDWLTKLLAKNRGITSPQELDEFLNPSFEQITGQSIGNTKKAIDRIEKAIKNKEKVIIYSDYDADGICATAIMWEALYDLGIKVMPYVPHRIKEGYGLANPAISDLAKQGVKLIITVDHGVTAIDQVEHAKKLGIDVIITDHHVLPKKLPDSYALTHTTSLCGAGVSWRLAWDIVAKLNRSYQEKLKSKLELASIATIADLVPLIGANRAIVKIGLEKLASTKRFGINALIKATGITPPIGTYEIGHIIAPRINAMGRIEHGLDALRLICAKNRNQAEELASLLTKTNSKRQDLTSKAIESAFTLVKEEQSVGVITHPTWHEGIIGLVASRLVETYHRPFIVIAKGEVYSKGSARSVPGFNIVEAIRASGTFLNAGGHPMAAGFTIETKQIEIFSAQINKYAQTNLTDDMLEPVVNIESELETKDISTQTLSQIKRFEPFGMGNPEPVFLTRHMEVEDVRGVGPTSAHLKLQLSSHSAIGFNMGEFRARIRPGYKIDAVYTLNDDKYNGGFQLKLKDLEITN